MDTPSDLYLLEDPMAIFLSTTKLINDQQAALDKIAAVRARAVAALYARGYTYKQLAERLDLSAPRVGQLIGSADEAALTVIRSWTEIERLLAQIARNKSDGSRSTYGAAIAVLVDSRSFSEQGLADLDQLHKTRNDVAHARRDVSLNEAELFAASARYLAALLQVFLSEEGQHCAESGRQERAMPRIRFDELSPREYEDMVSVLLSRERQTHRVDGAGGDGGIDCYFSDETGTEAFELKSFTGRMTQSRRTQVKKSLTRALRHSLRSWTLVVPIDPTPAERQWFDDLQSGVSVQLAWSGKTWLEEKLAEYPDIARYFAGAADEVVRTLAEIAREDALPSDALALSEQFGGAVRRLNEVDPYYRFSFSVASDSTTVVAYPRYPDAVRDRPLRISATLRFDDSPESADVQQALEEFMTFGTPVVIPSTNIEGLVVDAPGGLGGEFPRAELILDGTFEPPSEATQAIILRVPPLPPILQSLQLRIDSISRGPAGGLHLVARDVSGLLTLDMRLDPTRHSHRSHLTYKYLPNAYPADALPVLRLCSALATDAKIAITDTNGNIFGTASGSFGPDGWSEAYISCAEKLYEIQKLRGAAFPLPLDFTPDDQRDMDYVRALLCGESINANWDGMTSTVRADTVRNLLERIEEHGQPFAFMTMQEEMIELAGGRINLGWMQRYMPAALVSNLADIQNWHRVGGEGVIEMRIEPFGSNQMVIRHLPGGPPGAQPVVEGETG